MPLPLIIRPASLADLPARGHDSLPLVSMVRLAAAGNGASSHAVSVRIASAENEILRRIRTLWSDSGLRLPEAHVWSTSSTAAPHSDRAAQRRQKELALPVTEPAHCRIVLIRYAESVIDVVIAVDRRLLGHKTLLVLAAAIQNGESPEIWRAPASFGEIAAGEPPLLTATTSMASSVAELWGLGGLAPASGRGSLRGSELPCAGADSPLSAAIALTLSRFRGGGGALVASLISSGPEVFAESEEGLALFALPESTDETIAGFMKACADRRCFVGWHSTAVDLELRSGALAVDACLWFDLAQPEAVPSGQVEYCHRGHLAYPLNIMLERTDENGLRLHYSFDRSAYHEMMVAVFDRCVAHVYAQFAASSRGGPKQIDDVQLVAREKPDPAQHDGFAPTLAEPDSRGMIAEFQRFATEQPDAPAITFEGKTLNYAELDRLSTTFGLGLRKYGVRAGDRVGVCLERSLELVPVLAGVLKCGAIYVPIEPSAPSERQQFIVRDAGLRVLVTSRDDLAADSDVVVVSPSRLAEVAAQTDSCVSHDDPSIPAYIIYTSGSTGRPKGVLIAQQSVLALIRGLSGDLTLSPDDRWTLFHSAAFDFATWEIWGCLLTGGHLFVVPYFVSRSPDEFLQLLSQHRITVLNQTPTAFAQLQAADEAQRLDLDIRLVIFGGEALDASSLLPWMNRHSGSHCRLVNMYGITETTVHVTAELVTRRHALRGARTVGPPIPGWSVHIKDVAGRHLPPGLAGEIYVGGSGLAVGYWNNDEENRFRFAVDELTGERLYRSGDRGRIRPDGRLDHLGRLDNQVKLRGFRIELDEIRSVMLELDDVKVAQVIFREPTAGRPEEASIEAFVANSGRRGGDIRAELRDRLPDYMLPSRITLLDKLPLTANGKFDVAAALEAAERLASDEPPSPHGGKVFAATDAEEYDLTISALWSNVFGQDISPTDNFFDLGGNSLMAVKLASSMKKLNCPVASVRDIYVHQTPDQLAKVWREHAGA